jgi:predicted ester cyclase
MSVDENKQALRRALDRFNDGDLDGYLELYDPSVVLYGNGPEPLDLDGIRGFYEELGSAFSNGRVELEQVIGEDDWLAGRYTFHALHTGEFKGVPPTGREVAMTGITTGRFRDGRVVERWNSPDLLGLLMQIGALPAPAAA